MVSMADRLVKQPLKYSVLYHARKIDPEVIFAATDNMMFYYFSDGTKVGTKGRGRNFQMWNAGEHNEHQKKRKYRNRLNGYKV